MQWAMNPKINNELAEQLAAQTGLSNTVCTILSARGYNTPELIHQFLDFRKEYLRSGYKDMDAAVTLIAAAVQNRQVITVAGDYDCDGVMATTVLVRGLRRIGATVHWFINHRFNEGYGINVPSMTRLLDAYPDTGLVITCDNGITGFAAVDFLKAHGVQVVVSDHHIASPDGRLPDCPVVCEYRQDEAQEKEEICGAEMARRVLIALYRKLGIADEAFLDSLMAFSGTATVADAVPMTPANHWLIRQAEDMMQQRTVFTMLQDLLHIERINEEDIGFRIAPLVNAVSRMTGDVTPAVEMFLSDDPEEITGIAARLMEINRQRQEVTGAAEQAAAAEVAANRSEDAFLVLESGAAEGVCGLVASRMTEQFHRPCIVLSESGKGSARSVDGFNVKAALDQCSDLLEGYGGHEMAAGLSVRKENIPALRQQLCRIAADSGVLEKESRVLIDLEIPASAVDVRLIKDLDSLRPFGSGFKQPVLCVTGRVEQMQLLPKKSAEKKHTVLMLNRGVRKLPLRTLWWKHTADESVLHQQIAVIGSVGMGNTGPQMTVNQDLVRFR